MRIEIGDDVYFGDDDGWRARVVEHLCLTTEEHELIKKAFKEAKTSVPSFDSIILLKTRKG